MDNQTFWDKLKYMIEHCYYEDNKGMQMLLEFDPICQAFMDDPDRFEEYFENGRFRMTSTERFFHLIGFLNAIHWLHKNGYINHEEMEYDLSDSSILQQAVTAMKTSNTEFISKEQLEDMLLDDSAEGCNEFEQMVEKNRLEADLLRMVCLWNNTGSINETTDVEE